MLSDELQDVILVSSIIKLSLSTLHILWLKQCEMVHATLSGENHLEETVTILNAVR